MLCYIAKYWLKPITRTQSTTGDDISQERGPFTASIVGSYYTGMTEEDVTAYVQKMHGQDPVKIEITEIPEGTKRDRSKRLDALAIKELELHRANGTLHEELDRRRVEFERIHGPVGGGCA